MRGFDARLSITNLVLGSRRTSSTIRARVEHERPGSVRTPSFMTRSASIGGTATMAR
jgi:hypothetical protein